MKWIEALQFYAMKNKVSSRGMCFVILSGYTEGSDIERKAVNELHHYFLG